MDKSDIINRVYFDPAGYGSMANTLADARKKDKSITIDDVKAWFGKNIERKVGYKGYNSFIAEKPYEEFQANLFFYNRRGFRIQSSFTISRCIL